MAVILLARLPLHDMPSQSQLQPLIHLMGRYLGQHEIAILLVKLCPCKSSQIPGGGEHTPAPINTSKSQLEVTSPLAFNPLTSLLPASEARV